MKIKFNTEKEYNNNQKRKPRNVISNILHSKNSVNSIFSMAWLIFHTMKSPKPDVLL
jgi:hypothetical protein